MLKTDAVTYAPDILKQHERKHGEWLEKARFMAREIATQRGRVCADDIWAVCPPPGGVDPRVMGAVFHPRKKWKVESYVKSRRKECHGRNIPVWRKA